MPCHAPILFQAAQTKKHNPPKTTIPSSGVGSVDLPGGVEMVGVVPLTCPDFDRYTLLYLLLV